MGNKHLNRSTISGVPRPITETVYLDQNATKLDGWQQTGNNAYAFVSLRFVQHNYQCFSEWDKAQMNSFWAFNEKIHKYTWQQVLGQSGRTEAQGFAYKPLPLNIYPKSAFLEELSPDITLFELRLNSEARLHGFRRGSIFYICWLDRGHDITGS